MFEDELVGAQDYEGALPWLGDHIKESKDASCAAPEGPQRHMVGQPSSQMHPEWEMAVYLAEEGTCDARSQWDQSVSQTMYLRLEK